MLGAGLSPPSCMDNHCQALPPAPPRRPPPPGPQFGDRLILDYITHQRRLFPALAATYALHLGMLRLKAVLMKVGVGPPAGASPALRLCRNVQHRMPALPQRCIEVCLLASHQKAVLAHRRAARTWARRCTSCRAGSKRAPPGTACASFRTAESAAAVRWALGGLACQHKVRLLETTTSAAARSGCPWYTRALPLNRSGRTARRPRRHGLHGCQPHRAPAQRHERGHHL